MECLGEVGGNHSPTFPAYLSFRHMVRGTVAKLQGLCVDTDVTEPRLEFVWCVVVWVCVHVCIECIVLQCHVQKTAHQYM